MLILETLPPTPSGSIWRRLDPERVAAVEWYVMQPDGSIERVTDAITIDTMRDLLDAWTQHVTGVVADRYEVTPEALTDSARGPGYF